MTDNDRHDAIGMLKRAIEATPAIDINKLCDELEETLADLEHQQWVIWAQTLKQNEALSLKRLERWNELFVPYSLLSDESKEQDRIWARKVLAVIQPLIDAARNEAKLRERIKELELELKERGG